MQTNCENYWDHLMKKLILCIFLNILGILLYWSFADAPADGFWPVADKNVFFFFNILIGTNEFFRYLVAFTNFRFFDVVGFLAMFVILLYHYLKADTSTRHFYVSMGITMLVTAVLVKQFDMLLGFNRPSPTVFFPSQGIEVLRVSELTGWNTKDSSNSCFPGDHGMFLMIFSYYMLRYLGFRTFVLALIVTLVFSLPRVMSGAHWMTDITVGALSFNLVIVSWLLLTPASDKIIGFINRIIPWDKFRFKSL